ncbi:hypothetical protein ANANG_G00092180 [Anguilla anguilla]|uniref:Uncharacterized protein n=1 Tax=Anguilla anguilla TaxID=7936 RepID=A0A9D3MM02_ANGAN|nr:hypothetical protein ANANG_G00092180 [Anguilla anguilla]
MVFEWTKTVRILLHHQYLKLTEYQQNLLLPSKPLSCLLVQNRPTICHPQPVPVCKQGGAQVVCGTKPDKVRPRLASTVKITENQPAARTGQASLVPALQWKRSMRVPLPLLWGEGTS